MNASASNGAVTPTYKNHLGGFKDKQKIKNSLVGSKTSHALPQKDHWAMVADKEVEEPNSAMLGKKKGLRQSSHQHDLQKTISKDNSNTTQLTNVSGTEGRKP